MPPKTKNKSGKPWVVFPDLHARIAELLDEDNLEFEFEPKDTDRGNINVKDTFVMGRFFCQNNACACKGWGSKKIAITIREYPDQRYNARVYRQRCKGCEGLGRLKLDKDSYVQRITYRLRKWSDVIVEEPEYRRSSNNRPHESELCEGCRHGHCGWNY